MRWNAELFIKPAALLSFCGGPLLLTEALKPVVGHQGAFVVTALPVLVIAVGAFYLPDTDPEWWETAAVWLGLLGVLVLFVMNGYAVWQLIVSPGRADQSLYITGIIVGIAMSVMYGYGAKRFLCAHARG